MGETWGPTLPRRVVRALGLLCVFGVVWAAVTALTLFLAWGPLVLRLHGHSAVLLGVAVTGCSVCLIVPVAVGVHVDAHDDDAGMAMVVGAGIVILFAYGVMIFFGWHAVDQQALHDRGVAVTGVVTKEWSTYTPDGPASGVYVRMPDGTQEKLNGEQSAPGTRVVLTVDPRRHLGTRLGPPPGPPDWTGVQVCAAVVAAACLVVAAFETGPLVQDAGRLLRRGEPADRRPPEDAVPAAS